MLWISDAGGATAWVINWYVSPTVGDVPLFTLNTTTGAVSVSASAGGTFSAAILLAQAAANPQVQWNATGNPIDAKNWRMIVNGAGALVLSSYNDAGVLQKSFTFNRDGTMPHALLQTVTFETGAVATGTTIIPTDDTIPQQTEGDQYMSLAITPQSATSKLIIEVVAQLASSNGGVGMVAALFQDSGANAIAVGWANQLTVNFTNQVTIRHAMTSGTTSPTTFKVRCGAQSAGTTTFNGSAGARMYGGVLASSIVISEVMP
jgi:hypothetical protein